MRMPRPHSASARATLLALVALVATALVLVDPVGGAGQAIARGVAAAWRGVFPERPEPAFTQRVIVVLSAPSLADRMARAEAPPTSDEQKRWVGEADASQRIALARLRERGVMLRPEHSFTRTVNGFSAVVDARALTELERAPGIAGVYPVRTVYPASVGSDTLSRPEFGPAGGRRPSIGIPAFRGGDVKIALLDTGVDLRHPFLHRRVLRGVDVVAGDQLAAAERKPDEPGRLESHGTRMAGILVGERGPAGLRGIVPDAEIFPIRVLGWERAADGSYAVMGRGDALIAGLERAVDPDGDGDVDDAAKIALAAVVEPYAAFSDSPEARAVAGATRLGTLVVAAAGNDGRAGTDFGTVGGPGGAPAALTVGVVDARQEVLETRARLTANGETLLDEPARVLGAVAPTRLSVPVSALAGPTLADRRRAANTVASGATLADFFDVQGVSRVAGRAVLLPEGGGAIDAKARNAATAGAAVALVYGTKLPAGSLDLDETAGIPVVAVPSDPARAALEALVRGEAVSLSLGAPARVANRTLGQVAAFSSGGLAFDGHVKPDVVAPGIAIATSDGGRNGDGTPRYATATGASAAAAIAAGAAAVVAQARPGLAASELKSVLVGSARQLTVGGAPEPVTVQGAGMVDAAAAAASEVAVEPTTLAFGRVEGGGWRVVQALKVRNLSIRRLDVGFAVARDAAEGPDIAFGADPARLTLSPGASRSVILVASAASASGGAGGAFLVVPDGSGAVRVPWAVSFRGSAQSPLLTGVALSTDAFSPSDTAPAVLAFRAGRVESGDAGYAVEAVAVLSAELWTRDGRRLGVLARLRDLLPGRYAFGLTGRGPDGKKLEPGDYVVRLRARPVPGDTGARPSTVDVPFTITG